MSAASETIEARREALRPLAETVLAVLADEVSKLGFGQEEFSLPLLGSAEFKLARDPFSGEDSVEASWSNPHGHRLGSMLFHADGSFYAEIDVVKPHPTDGRWFVEGVAAWGKAPEVRAEPKLLPMDPGMTH